MGQIEHHTAVVPESDAGKRLDRALAELFPEYSRSRLKEWILAGQVRVDDRVLRPHHRLAGGERIALAARHEAAGQLAPQAIPLDVVYEDEAILVLDKAAGLVVHPGAGNPDGTVQNALLHLDPGLAEVPRSGIVHRLDKDTSGLMMVARTAASHQVLVGALERREVRRIYLAVCQGRPPDSGEIDAPIGRHRVDRVRMTVRADGRPALTRYRVEERYRRHALLRVSLATGRTHQIRVHFAHLRHPLVGDPVYGARTALPPDAGGELVRCLRGFTRQALHATRLALVHPLSGAPLEFHAPLPGDMAELVAALRDDARAA